MKLFVCLCLLAISAASAANVASAVLNDDETFLRNEFELFVDNFGKVYDSELEREARFSVFKANVAKIQRHNLSGSSYKMKVTRFSDLTDEEFRARHLGGYVNTKSGPISSTSSAPKSNIDLAQFPASMDWLDSGAITAVKDQGSCGSCWAFTAVEQIESYAILNGGTPTELSAQQLTSCTPNELKCGGSGGCGGLIPQTAWAYVQLFGVTTEAEYGYFSGTTGQTGGCAYDPATAAASLRGFEVLPRNNYAAVMDHLVNVGPLAIAIDANGFGQYSEGVFDGCSYTENIEINHAIQLVGYGTDEESGKDYWLARNQWGTQWGDNGYIKLLREEETQCGYDRTPLNGVACENDGNDEQYVCGMCAMLYDVAYPIGVELL